MRSSPIGHVVVMVTVTVMIPGVLMTRPAPVVGAGIDAGPMAGDPSPRDIADRILKDLSRDPVSRGPGEPFAGFRVLTSTNKGRDVHFRIGARWRTQFGASLDCHVYLIDLDAGGKASLFFPAGRLTDNFIPANQVRTIPSESDEKNTAYYRITGPSGKDQIVAVASTRPISITRDHLRMLEQHGVDRFRREMEGLTSSAGARLAFDSSTIWIDDGNASQAQPRTWAVVIGIDAYQRKPLNGPARDALHMKSFLRQTLRVPEDRIRCLVDRGATRDRIREAIAGWLPETVRTGDRVFIYYSGHGSFIKDLNGDEPDGTDEVLIPVDTRPDPDPAATARYNIIDDDFHQWVKKVSDRGPSSITILFDCCHSGTAIKGIARGSHRHEDALKYYPPWALHAPVRPYEVAVKGAGEPEEPEPSPDAFFEGTLDLPNVFYMAACAPSQVSWCDFRMPPEERLSLFTRIALEGLRGPADANNDRSITGRELYDFVRPKVAEWMKQNEDEILEILEASQLQHLPARMDPHVTSGPGGDRVVVNR